MTRPWRFTPWPTSTRRAIHLTVPRNDHPRAAGGGLYRLHRRDLQATDITTVDAIPVTTAARTIKDCLDPGTDPYQLRTASPSSPSAAIHFFVDFDTCNKGPTPDPVNPKAQRI